MMSSNRRFELCEQLVQLVNALHDGHVDATKFVAVRRGDQLYVFAQLTDVADALVDAFPPGDDMKDAKDHALAEYMSTELMNVADALAKGASE